MYYRTSLIIWITSLGLISTTALADEYQFVCNQPVMDIQIQWDCDQNTCHLKGTRHQASNTNPELISSLHAWTKNDPIVRQWLQPKTIGRHGIEQLGIGSWEGFPETDETMMTRWPYQFSGDDIDNMDIWFDGSYRPLWNRIVNGVKDWSDSTPDIYDPTHNVFYAIDDTYLDKYDEYYTDTIQLLACKLKYTSTVENIISQIDQQFAEVNKDIADLDEEMRAELRQMLSKLLPHLQQHQNIPFSLQMSALQLATQLNLSASNINDTIQALQRLAKSGLLTQSDDNLLSWYTSILEFISDVDGAEHLTDTQIKPILHYLIAQLQNLHQTVRMAGIVSERPTPIAASSLATAVATEETIPNREIENSIDHWFIPKLKMSATEFNILRRQPLFVIVEAFGLNFARDKYKIAQHLGIREYHANHHQNMEIKSLLKQFVTLE